MKNKNRIGIVVLVAGACALLGGPAVSQDPGGDAAKQMEMMKKWMEVLKETDHHKRLGKLVGTWTTESEMHGMGKGTGEATVRWIIPKKTILGEMKGTMMNQPVQSVWMSTWDNYKKKYVTVSANSMHPGFLPSEGVVVDPTHKVLVTYGPMDEFLTGEHDKTVKYVTRWINDDEFVYEVWDLGIGEAGKAVVTTRFKRKK